MHIPEIDPKIKQILGMFGICLVMSVFVSWTTQKNMQDTMASYAKYQFGEQVSAVLNAQGGVVDQIQDVKNIALETKEEVLKNNAAMYQDWINDINKYYGWCDGSHDSMLSIGYAEKMSNYWKNLPDSYKSDILQTKYNYAFAYITRVCK